MTSSNPDDFPKAPSLNTLPLGLRVSTCKLCGDTIQSIIGQNRSPNLPPPPSLFLFCSSHSENGPKLKSCFWIPICFTLPFRFCLQNLSFFNLSPHLLLYPLHCPFSTQHIIQPIKSSSRLAHPSLRALQHLHAPLLPRVYKVLPNSNPYIPPHYLHHHPWVSSPPLAELGPLHSVWFVCHLGMNCSGTCQRWLPHCQVKGITVHSWSCSSETFVPCDHLLRLGWAWYTIGVQYTPAELTSQLAASFC